MKKITLLAFTMIIGTLIYGQSDKYTKAMQTQMAFMDSAFSKGNFTEIANNFERIATAEKNQWLPYYYAAYLNVMKTMAGDDKSNADANADKADELITKAEEANGKANSETQVIKSMIATAHMMVDPQSRWMQYGQASAKHIETAKELDATNPRPYYLEATGKMYTPEAFGGGKAIAKPIFERTLALYDAFKPASELHPNWGKKSAQQSYSLCQ